MTNHFQGARDLRTGPARVGSVGVLCYPSRMEAAVERNRAFYEKMNSGTEDYWRKMAAPRMRVNVLAQELKRLAPASIADLGCGNGALLAELRRAVPYARFAGLDLSAPQIEANRARYPWAEFHVANLCAPIALSDRYEAVVSTELIEHLDEPEAFLASARQLLHPGGYLVLTTQSGPLRETERRVGHVRHFTAAKLEAMLEQAGLEPVRVWNAGFPFHDLSKWYANIDPDKTMSQFGDKAYGWKENAICAALRLAFRFNSNRYGAQLFAIARSPR